ncbi:MAG: hypothetical protein ABJ215_02080 [Alphaproteobacteria bacterium]
MPDNAPDFAFATVTSQGYVDQTAGLLLNLREYYPDTTVVICALDDGAAAAFEAIEDSHLVTVTAETVWGPDCWRNMTARMTRAERAFATKSAICAWTLETQARSLLLLDSDLLFLDRTDDIVELLEDHPAVLVTGRHGVDEWSKAGRFGLFSAGVLGLSRSTLREVAIWKAACFNACTAVPLSGIYYEQKYLDPFLNLPGVALVHDPGINISQTFLKLLAPYQDDDGKWRVKGGTQIRIYHASRSSDDSFPLFQDKADWNRRGLEMMGLAPDDGAARQAPGLESGSAKLQRRLALGRRFTNIVDGLPGFLLRVMEIYRTLTLRDLPFKTRWHETFSRKKDLARALEDDAGRHQGSSFL